MTLRLTVPGSPGLLEYERALGLESHAYHNSYMNHDQSTNVDPFQETNLDARDIESPSRIELPF